MERFCFLWEVVTNKDAKVHVFRYVVVNSQGLRNNKLRCNAFNNSNSTRGVTRHTGTYGMIKILLRHIPLVNK